MTTEIETGQASEYKPRSRAVHIVANNAVRRVAIHSPWLQETKYFDYEESNAMRGYFLDILRRYEVDTRKHVEKFYINNQTVGFDHVLRALHCYGTLPQTKPADIDTLNAWFNSSELQA